MIKVRKIRPGDEKGIAEVSKSAIATLRKTYRPNKKAIENKAEISNHLNRLVAILNHSIAGIVEYRISGKKLSIIGLDVHKDYRMNGVAKRLVEHLSNKGRKKKVNYLSLHTIEETGNVAIFKKLGFKVVSRSIDQFSESDQFTALTDVKMQKII